MIPEPVGSTHLRFGDARVVKEISMWLPNVVRSPERDLGRHEEFWNGPEVKIDILDEGYWSPELFRGYQVTTSVSERGFGGPDKRWGALCAKGRGHISPLTG